MDTCQEENLVSIVTPCYNTGHLIHRLLDSVLLQDYRAIEMFCIDDGSTDNTREIIESYNSKFEQKGYSLYYIIQENEGQSSAVNNGLKRIHGEYLIWPDSDDFFYSEKTISTMVEVLKNNVDYGLCRCLTIYADEKSLEQKSKTPCDENFMKEQLFEDSLLNENGFMWGAGNYMVRVSSLKDVNPRMEIYTEKSAGQNWQMLLPLLYRYRCYSIPEYLYCVLLRETSHSRGFFIGYDGLREKLNVYERTIIATLKKLIETGCSIDSRYFDLVNIKYGKRRLTLALENWQKDDILSEVRLLKSLNCQVEPKIYCYAFIASNKTLYKCISKIREIKRVFIYRMNNNSILS